MSLKYNNIRQIFDMFLNTITDDLYINVFTTDYERYSDLDTLFRMAVAHFKGCKINIDYVTELGYGPSVPGDYGNLVEPLTNDEVLVLLAYMELFYLKRTFLEMSQSMDSILDTGIKRQSISQNLKSLGIAVETVDRKAQKLNKDYTKDLSRLKMAEWYNG